MDIYLASVVGLSSQLTSVSETFSDFLWFALIPFFVVGILRLVNFSGQSVSEDNSSSDTQETKDDSLLDGFPVDESVKDENLISSTDTSLSHQSSVEPPSSKIDLNKPPSI